MESLFDHYLSTAKSEFAQYDTKTNNGVSIDKNRPAVTDAYRLHIHITLILCHLSCSKEFFEQQGRGQEVEEYIAKYTSLLAMLNSYVSE